MNFLIDSQLPPALVGWMVDKDHQASPVFDLSLQSADDLVIGGLAKKERLVLVSKDEDFVDLWLLSDEEVKLVWVRKGNCSNRALFAWLEPMWFDTLKRLEQGERLIELRA